MGLSRNFIFLGQRSDPEDFYPLMHCLVFATEVPESFGRVMAEAMGCGIPVVASDLGAAREIVVEGETGFFFQPGQPKSLAEALRRILSDPEKAKQMGERGRQRAESLFDSNRILKPLLAAYGL